jgi:uncharacterized protein DUF899
MTEAKHKVGTRADWLAARWRCLSARRNSRGEATSSPVSAGRFPGCRSRSATRSRSRPDAGRSPSFSRGARSRARLSSHVRPRRRARLRRLLVHRRQLGWRRPASELPRSQLRSRLAGATGEALPLQSRDGLELPLGLLLWHRLQPRLLRLHRAGAAHGGRVQLRLVGSYPRPRGRAPRAERFALEDGVLYHTYSTYDRGTDGLTGTWQLLDRAPARPLRHRAGGSAAAQPRVPREGHLGSPPAGGS